MAENRPKRTQRSEKGEGQDGGPMDVDSTSSAKRGNDVYEDASDSELISKRPIKVYPFSINELSEENARHWFYEMQNQLDAQYAWQVIELYAQKRLEEYAWKMARPAWQRVNKQANLIMGKGLSSIT